MVPFSCVCLIFGVYPAHPISFADHVSIVEPKEDVIPATPYSEQKAGKLPEQAAAAPAAQPAPAVPMA